MALTHEVVKSEITKLDKKICQDFGATDEGKKFSLLMLKKMSRHKWEKLKNCFTDGGGDHQIDGVYFIEEGDDLQVNVLTCVFRSNNKAIADKDITDFINNGLKYLLFNEKNVPDINDRIKKIKKEFDELKNSYEGKFTIVVKFINTSNQVLSHIGENEFMKFQSDLQKNNVQIEYEKINGDQISAFFFSKTSLKTLIPIRLSGKSYYPLLGKEGFVCRLPVQEIIKMYKGFTDEAGRSYQGYGDFLFEDNVRKDMGLEKAINKKIYETATDSRLAADFEYFNNGLTIIYESNDASIFGDSPTAYLKGLQVVNGCQTVNTLMRANEDGKLSEDVYVTCRFIKRGEDKFIQSVVTYTNSQNAISNRDLHANDNIQFRVQTILKNFGILYERKYNEFHTEEDDKRMDALDAAQAYYCCVLREPHRAKQDKRKLFSELYHRIFDDSDDDLSYKLLISYRIMEYVLSRHAESARKKRQTKKSGKKPRYNFADLIIAYGSYHIAAILYKEEIDSKSSSLGFRDLAEKRKLVYSDNFKYQEALERIKKFVKEQKINKDELLKFFKTVGLPE